MENYIGLILTLLLGIYIIIGSLFVFLSKNSKKFVEVSISIALGVIVMLIILDILPETLEIFKTPFMYGILLMLIVFGFAILVILDKFIPDHDDDLNTTKDDNNNLKHIGFISACALMLHNIIEGMALYTTAMTDTKAAVMLSLGIGLHNIPLGMVVTSTLFRQKKDKNKTIPIMILVAISSFIGGLIMIIFNKYINELVVGILLAITLGMLLYIAIMELLPKVRHMKNKTDAIVSFLIGVFLMTLTLFFE